MRVADTPPAPVKKLAPGPGKPASRVAASQRARLHRAMFELVAQKGYDQVTVRELVSAAKVSSRAFYEHFESKADCFAQTHQMIARRIVRAIDGAQAGEPSRQERLRLAVDAFAHELAHDPQAGHLALVDVYSMGPDGFHHLRRLERAFAKRIEMDFPAAVSEEDSSLLTEGMVSGIFSVGRSRLLAGAEDELPALAGPLAGWALSLRGAPPAEASHFPSSASWEERRRGARAPQGERALLLSAVTKLVASEGYEAVTERAIQEVAGTSGRTFAAHFDDVQECFLTAVEERTREALSRAAEAQASASNWAAGVHRATDSICAEVANDPVFAGAHFDAVFAAGVRGVQCRERLTNDIARQLRKGAPSRAYLDRPVVEASVGAAWGILDHCVAKGRARQALRLSPALAHLVLGPALGADAATFTISRQQDFPGSNSLLEPTQSIEQQTGVKQSCTSTE